MPWVLFWSFLWWGWPILWLDCLSGAILCVASSHPMIGFQLSAPKVVAHTTHRFVYADQIDNSNGIAFGKKKKKGLHNIIWKWCSGSSKRKESEFCGHNARYKHSMECDSLWEYVCVYVYMKLCFSFFYGFMFSVLLNVDMHQVFDAEKFFVRWMLLLTWRFGVNLEMHPGA